MDRHFCAIIYNNDNSVIDLWRRIFADRTRQTQKIITTDRNYASVSVCLCVYIFLCVFCSAMYVCMSVPVFLCVCLCRCVCLSVCLYVYLSTCLLALTLKCRSGANPLAIRSPWTSNWRFPFQAREEGRPGEGGG